jgi:hypothetical protein
LARCYACAVGSSPKRRSGVIRRIARGAADTAVSGGIARMGGGGDRTGHTLQTRPVIDSVLSTYRDADEQDERTRAVWSLGGAFALAVLGALTAANSLAAGTLGGTALGLAQLVFAALVVVIVARRTTQGSVIHLAGVGLAVISVYESVFAYPPFVGEHLALVGLGCAVGAMVGLIVGRR